MSQSILEPEGTAHLTFLGQTKSAGRTIIAICVNDGFVIVSHSAGRAICE